jgi:hypothetical protein
MAYSHYQMQQLVRASEEDQIKLRKMKSQNMVIKEVPP